jgi:hypothetical protein
VVIELVIDHMHWTRNQERPAVTGSRAQIELRGSRTQPDDARTPSLTHTFFV